MKGAFLVITGLLSCLFAGCATQSGQALGPVNVPALSSAASSSSTAPSSLDSNLLLPRDYFYSPSSQAFPVQVRACYAQGQSTQCEGSIWNADGSHVWIESSERLLLFAANFRLEKLVEQAVDTTMVSKDTLVDYLGTGNWVHTTMTVPVYTPILDTTQFSPPLALYPDSITNGGTWSNAGVGVSNIRSGHFSPHKTVAYNVQNTIAKVPGGLTVSNRQFPQVILVTQTLTTQETIGGLARARSITSSVRYYAKGVGLIKETVVGSLSPERTLKSIEENEVPVLSIP